MRLSPLFSAQQSYPSRPSPRFGMALSQETNDALNTQESRRRQIAAYLQRIQLPDAARASNVGSFMVSVAHLLTEITNQVHQLGLSEDDETLTYLNNWANETVKTLSSSAPSGFWLPTNIHSLMGRVDRASENKTVPHLLTQPFTDYLQGISPE